MIIFIWTLALVLLILSFKKDKVKTQMALRSVALSLKKMTRGIFLMIALLALALAVVSKEHLLALFSLEGSLGLFLVSLVGAIITIPGPIAFPLAGSLLKLGTSKALLASFITTLTMVGITTFPFEAKFFGLKFTLLRQSLSYMAAVIIGLAMGAMV